MPIELRTATDEDLPAMFASDACAFGFTYEQQDIDVRRSIIEPARFHLAVEHGRIVGIAGIYTLEMTVPGGRSLPTGGLTWVHVATTHRRQGPAREMIAAALDDSRVAMSRSPACTPPKGIYERFSYGTAGMIRRTSLDRQRSRIPRRRAGRWNRPLHRAR